ncbi:MAG TPA: APC family permease [Mycobacteriales bacterium]
MGALTGAAKRLLVGRPLRSEALGETLLPKKLALPVFASDAVSSVAYAVDEILLVLAVGGIAFYHYAWYIAGAVALLVLIVVASYRQNVHAYPSGGGDYEVATVNLSPYAGLTVASALMVDYVLTVAVSVSSGVANVASAVTSLQGHAVAITVGIVIVIMLLNLRGLRESGVTFALPTYAFILGVGVLIVGGLFEFARGHHPRAATAQYDIHATASHLTGLALVFLLLRGFASGCAALTGIEAISNGVPAFKVPKSKNAATTLALLGGIAVTLLIGVTILALATHVHITVSDSNLVGFHGNQKTVLAQIGGAVFGTHSPIFFYIQGVTGLILVLAANTAFNGFPVLASILAQDKWLPGQLRSRGDRLIYSNGVLLLAGFAIVLIVAFHASPTRLIQLYIIGVFVSFVNSQSGMIRHWNRLLRTEQDPTARRRMKRSRVINSIGAGFTAVVLVIVLVTKFMHGAWIVVVAMPVIFLLMRQVRRHYERVGRELTPPPGPPVLPSRVHSLVLVSKLHSPTLRALAFARAAKPHTLEGVTVSIDDQETQALQKEWVERGIPIPLVLLSSPYRELTQPVIDYIRDIRRESPRDVVAVYIPEYVVEHWWEQILHNQSPLRLKARLLSEPGVMVTSVPYRLSGQEGEPFLLEDVDL